MIQFEWDPAKAKTNLRKHGVAFREGVTVLRDPLGITIFDPDHSDEEDRFITFGFSVTGRLLMVAHAERGERIRIISARGLSRAEREVYEQEIQRRKN
ncbi:MAG: BrnT family toxin [Deltaproteobacteria bacterium]|nr:BrnT family toxin [Deltaproteobacteria bacterium]